MNSGVEAGETAVKLARKWAYEVRTAVIQARRMSTPWWALIDVPERGYHGCMDN